MKCERCKVKIAQVTLKIYGTDYLQMEVCFECEDGLLEYIDGACSIKNDR